MVGMLFASAALCQDQGLALFHKMQQALGGADAIAAIQDLDWTVHADTFNHDGKLLGSVTKRTRWIKPNYLRLDQIGRAIPTFSISTAQADGKSCRISLASATSSEAS